MCQGEPMLNINTGFLLSGNLQSGGEGREESNNHIKNQHIREVPGTLLAFCRHLVHKYICHQCHERENGMWSTSRR